jgi:hypothetical protein
VVEIQRADQVDGDDLVPEIRFGFQELQRDVPAGVVDQNVDAFQVRVYALDRLRHRGVIGDIELERRQTLSMLLQRRLQLVEAVSIEVESNHTGTFLAEALTEAAADAARRAGNDSDFVVEATHKD